MIKQIFPTQSERQLEGLYLDLNLHQRAKPGDVFIYANYISSLDGRISLLNRITGEYGVPEAIANARDWRLYQELAAQSDVMLTSARYFRQLARGMAQDLLPVAAGPAFEDIKAWRQLQGLKPQPDVVILSDSLDIPLEAIAKLPERKIFVFTRQQQQSAKVKRLEDAGVHVIQCGDAVSGSLVRENLITLGYQSAYMIAGPKVHHTLVVDSCLNELFLTLHLSLLGGASFHSLLDGDMGAANMKLLSIYMDEQAGQMFMRYQYQ